MKAHDIYEMDLSHITKTDLRKAGYKTLEEAMLDYSDYIIDNGEDTEVTFEEFLSGEY